MRVDSPGNSGKPCHPAPDTVSVSGSVWQKVSIRQPWTSPRTFDYPSDPEGKRGRSTVGLTSQAVSDSFPRYPCITSPPTVAATPGGGSHSADQHPRHIRPATDPARCSASRQRVRPALASDDAQTIRTDAPMPERRPKRSGLPRHSRSRPGIGFAFYGRRHRTPGARRVHGLTGDNGALAGLCTDCNAWLQQILSSTIARFAVSGLPADYVANTTRFGRFRDRRPAIETQLSCLFRLH